MNARPLVIFHDSCRDGDCCQWIARGVLGAGADYLPAHYGQPPPDVGGRQVYLLDFSYKRNVLLEMASEATSIQIIDHHKTAEAELAGIADEIPGIACTFDVTKSAGRLTWEHFHPGRHPPWLVDYTEDRDLWRWKLPRSKEVSAFIASWPFDFDRWNYWSTHGAQEGLSFFDGMVDQGEAILRHQGQVVDQAVKNAVEIVLDGHAVLCVNTTTLTSEIGERLAQGRPFAATWFERADGTRIWSLRSREGGIDVSGVAKRHGGGGHPQAAGFQVDRNGQIVPG